MQQKLTDYIADFFARNSLEHVFMLTGGGAMHLNNSLGKHKQLTTIYNHHEQASSMAAESYARLSGKMAVLNVTTGPGGINTLNGVFGAYVDSVPMFVVSGQVKLQTSTYSYPDLPLRQLGDQECRIIDMVDGITKYAIMVTDKNDIKYHLEKALFMALSGRPGPVWLDIPMDIQGSTIETDDLKSFDPASELFLDQKATTLENAELKVIVDKINQAQRPVIMVGAGIRLSGMHDAFMQLIEVLKIPVVTAWNAHDALHDGHPYHAGKPGSIGDRAGNFAVQNADLLIVLGSRLNVRQVSYNWQSFARHAYKIMVDIDNAELNKPTLSIDMPICADLKAFIPALRECAVSASLVDKKDWVAWCKQRKERYPVVVEEYWKNKDSVNPYCFMKRLSEHLPENQVIVTGDGTACVTSFQAVELKAGQRLYTNSGSASMGYDIPAAIGACVASGNQRIVCLAGDGSIMQNIQELAVIAANQYPISLFILNNNGYHSIRQTQKAFFGEPMVGVGPETGLGFPDFEKLTAGFGLPYMKCSNHDELTDRIAEAVSMSGPVVCEVMIDLEQSFSPKLSSRRLEDGTMVTSPLEDMAPFLSREELQENMLVEEVSS